MKKTLLLGASLVAMGIAPAFAADLPARAAPAYTKAPVMAPMYNWSVPSTLKAWIDHIVRIRRTFRSTPAGKIGILHHRPLIVVSAHGGYCGDVPGQPDFLTPYLRAVFETIGIRSAEFLRLEGLARGPAAVAYSTVSAAWATNASRFRRSRR